LDTSFLVYQIESGGSSEKDVLGGRIYR